MTLRQRVANALLGMIIKELGGENIEKMCIKGEFMVDKGDVNIKVSFCKPELHIK